MNTAHDYAITWYPTKAEPFRDAAHRREVTLHIETVAQRMRDQNSWTWVDSVDAACEDWISSKPLGDMLGARAQVESVMADMLELAEKLDREVMTCTTS